MDEYYNRLVAADGSRDRIIADLIKPAYVNGDFSNKRAALVGKTRIGPRPARPLLPRSPAATPSPDDTIEFAGSSARAPTTTASTGQKRPLMLSWRTDGRPH
jgi:hypothetical protein